VSWLRHAAFPRYSLPVEKHLGVLCTGCGKPPVLGFAGCGGVPTFRPVPTGFLKLHFCPCFFPPKGARTLERLERSAPVDSSITSVVKTARDSTSGAARPRCGRFRRSQPSCCGTALRRISCDRSRPVARPADRASAPTPEPSVLDGAHSDAAPLRERLIAEVDAAASAPGELAEQAHARALDPVLSADEVAAARQQMEDLRFHRQRLETAGGRLGDGPQELRANEEGERRWTALSQRLSRARCSRHGTRPRVPFARWSACRSLRAHRRERP
jgi:hypothetical protein